MADLSDPELPDTFSSKYYDEQYYKDAKGKAFTRPSGLKQRWGYRNKDGDFEGADIIARAWKTVFHSENLLDVGCGRGVFVAYCRSLGLDAFGIDFSSWAVTEGRFDRCEKDWVMVHDATKPWPFQDAQFDLLVLLDFFEHIYLEDLDPVLDEMFRVAKEHVFIEVATVDGVREKPFTLEKGSGVPLELSGYAVAGHTNVQTVKWWQDKLDREGWLHRPDLVDDFRFEVEQHSPYDLNMNKVNPIENWVSVIALSKESYT